MDQFLLLGQEGVTLTKLKEKITDEMGHLSDLGHKSYSKEQSDEIFLPLFFQEWGSPKPLIRYLKAFLNLT